MNVRRVLIDSSVPLYALGSSSVWKDSCRDVLHMLADGSLVGLASCEMIQEVVHHRVRMTDDRVRAVADARDVGDLVTVVAFDKMVLATALDLIGNTGIRGRDAVHAATALVHGATVILSTDSDFDTVPGLTRIDPRDLQGTM